MIKFRVKKYLAPQVKNLLGSAFHASFVQDQDAPDWSGNALRCAYVKLGIGRSRMKMYWAPQAKNFLGSAFYTSFV